MKTLGVFACIVILLFAVPLFADDKNNDFVCMSEKEAKKSGYDINNMRSEYPPMLSPDDSCAFPGQRAEVMEFISPISRKLADIAAQGKREEALIVFATLFFDKDGSSLFFFFEGLPSGADRDAFCNVVKGSVFPLQSDIPYSYCFTLRIS